MSPAPRHGSYAVHLPCGTVRGEHPLFVQDCPCAPVVQRPGVFGRLLDLCAVCGHGLAFSGTPYSSLGCRTCTALERALRDALGHAFLPLARRRPLDAVVEPDGTRSPYRPATFDLWPVAADLPAHGRRVVRDLARGLDGEDLPLQVWQVLHPESLEVSVAAYQAVLGARLPDRVVQACRETARDPERGSPPRCCAGSGRG